ncbi:MAG: metallopeptidase family protein [candidate division Zixibacteria bacterium]|nr:metallopeptidase family protein [candidate division Zixibacteria bacterium]
MFLKRNKFKQIVKEGISAIPEKFLKQLNNVAIVIEPRPTEAQAKKLHLRQDMVLFGLYEGVPQTRRGLGYSGVLPDKITIFQESIESAAQDEKDIQEIVKNTVWHEIAHHFGMDEREVRAAEERRREKN